MKAEYVYRKGRGFTLLELMIVVAILGVLAGLAAPSFSQLIARNRAEAIEDDLVRGVNLARSEAVKRSADVRFMPIDDTDWNQGWQVIADGNRDGDYTDAVEDAPLFISGPIHATMTITENTDFSLAEGYLAFNAFGALSTVSDNLSISVQDTQCKYHRTILLRVNLIGQITREEQDCS